MHWNEQWHLLFVDQPLGVGFSEYGAAGPSHSLRDTTAQLYGVLQALLRTHPEVSHRGFEPRTDSLDPGLGGRPRTPG